MTNTNDNIDYDLYNYWEYEITDRKFDELMLFIREKEQDGVIVKINSSPKECDIAINSMTDFFKLKDEIRSWLKTHRAEQYKNIENKYPNSAEW